MPFVVGQTCQGSACCGMTCVTQQCQAHHLTVLEVVLDALNLEALATAQSGRQAGRWVAATAAAAGLENPFKGCCTGWCHACDCCGSLLALAPQITHQLPAKPSMVSG